MDPWHNTVLAAEVVASLPVAAGQTAVDCTVGDGGHMLAFCQRWGSELKLLGLDADPEQLKRAQRRLAGAECSIRLIPANFRQVYQVASAVGYSPVQAILFDLGWSTPQLESSGRGFSLRRSEPLRMTYSDGSQGEELTAYEVVNSWREDTLRDLLRTYGEERFAGRIARRLVRERERSPLETTEELAGLVEQAVPASYRRQRLHPATRTFQALRIAVNDELGALDEGLDGALELLGPRGRVAVISFHSLEDRMVKQRFRRWQREGQGEIVTKKPLRPSIVEREGNPRSRSAKLRVFEKRITS